MSETIHCREDFLSVLRNAGSRLVVAEFLQRNCGHCRTMSSSFNDLADRYYNVKFCTIDINEVQDLDLCSFITGTPTFYFYRNQQKIHEYVGSNASTLENKIQQMM
ncbi:thioredoxin-like [Ambystoma mexicanum]|uniref:thioredoxin-like n=1 Tax=Ambystoma mexicanum TaxID=8296 RepID=UPI0037E9B7DB